MAKCRSKVTGFEKELFEVVGRQGKEDMAYWRSAEKIERIMAAKNEVRREAWWRRGGRCGRGVVGAWWEVVGGVMGGVVGRGRHGGGVVGGVLGDVIQMYCIFLVAKMHKYLLQQVVTELNAHMEKLESLLRSRSLLVPLAHHGALVYSLLHQLVG